MMHVCEGNGDDSDCDVGADGYADVIQLQQFSDGVRFIFPVGSVIQPNSYGMIKQSYGYDAGADDVDAD